MLTGIAQICLFFLVFVFCNLHSNVCHCLVVKWSLCIVIEELVHVNSNQLSPSLCYYFFSL